MKRDSGLQPERSALAWARTAMALFVNSLLILRAGMIQDKIGFITLGLLLVASSGLFWFFGKLRTEKMLGTGPVLSGSHIHHVLICGCGLVASITGAATMVI